jgi:hypothetical protein
MSSRTTVRAIRTIRFATMRLLVESEIKPAGGIVGAGCAEPVR